MEIIINRIKEECLDNKTKIKVVSDKIINNKEEDYSEIKIRIIMPSVQTIRIKTKVEYLVNRINKINNKEVFWWLIIKSRRRWSFWQ